MSRAIPCPASLTALEFAWAAREFDVTSPHALKMAEAMYRAIKKRFDAGEGIAKKENIRVMLWFPEIVHCLHLTNWMQEKFGAT